MIDFVPVVPAVLCLPDSVGIGEKYSEIFYHGSRCLWHGIFAGIGHCIQYGRYSAAAKCILLSVRHSGCDLLSGEDQKISGVYQAEGDFCHAAEEKIVMMKNPVQQQMRTGFFDRAIHRINPRR